MRFAKSRWRLKKEIVLNCVVDNLEIFAEGGTCQIIKEG